MHRVMAFKSFDKSLADLSDSLHHWCRWLWLPSCDDRLVPNQLQLWVPKMRGRQQTPRIGAPEHEDGALQFWVTPEHACAS